MSFQFASLPLNEADIAALEKQLKVKLPAPVRALYLQTNGGRPPATVFLPVDTSISQLIPIKDDGPGLNAVKSYTRLVLERELVPRHFFPFACDGGGDYFFVDTRTEIGDVYFYDSQHDEPLTNLNMDFDTFWASLITEEEADERDRAGSADRETETSLEGSDAAGDDDDDQHVDAVWQIAEKVIDEEMTENEGVEAVMNLGKCKKMHEASSLLQLLMLRIRLGGDDEDE